MCSRMSSMISLSLKRMGAPLSGRVEKTLPDTLFPYRFPSPFSSLNAKGFAANGTLSLITLSQLRGSLQAPRFPVFGQRREPMIALSPAGVSYRPSEPPFRPRAIGRSTFGPAAAHLHPAGRRFLRPRSLGQVVRFPMRQVKRQNAGVANMTSVLRGVDWRWQEAIPAVRRRGAPRTR